MAVYAKILIFREGVGDTNGKRIFPKFVSIISIGR